MSDLPLIDSHQHVFWHGRDDAGLVADMDAHNIEKAWLLTWEESAVEVNNVDMSVIDPRRNTLGSHSTMIPLTTIIDVCRRYPERFVPGYCPHPLDPQAVAKLAAAVDILGVRICGEWKFTLHIDDPRCLEIFRYAGSRGLPVVLHLDVPYLPPAGGTYVGENMWKGGSIDHLIRALELCPDTTFIGHAPGFWREMSGEADSYPSVYLKPPLAPGGRLPGVFERHANLYADLSAGSALRALMADVDNAKAFILRFADRLLFGRDYYGTELYDFLMSLNLPSDVWRKIGRENAERLLSAFKSAPQRPLLK
ncbi:MAG: amidohydrolase family protein [Gemmatimonadota bacterium]|nr:MAG: amidohydrolase family protein [Gemmatimonadota bacterium]